MRILFIGAVEFSAIALRGLSAIEAKLVGVCTISASVINADHINLNAIAQQAGIPVRDTSDINAAGTLEMDSRFGT